MKMIQSVIFDFDGTLFYSKESGKKILIDVCVKRGLSFDESKYDSMNGLTRKEKIKRLFPNKWQDLWAECSVIFEKNVEKNITLFPGV